MSCSANFFCTMLSHVVRVQISTSRIKMLPHLRVLKQSSIQSSILLRGQTFQILRCPYYQGMVTNTIYEQPKWMRRDCKPATMWQVFEVGVFDRYNDENVDIVRCTGYAPITLSPGDHIQFDGIKEYCTKHKCDLIKIKTLEPLQPEERDEELVEISRFAKGVSMAKLFTLRQQFKHKLVQTVMHSPDRIRDIPGIGPKTISIMQKAITKSSIDPLPPSEMDIPSETEKRVSNSKQSEKVIKSMLREEWIDKWCNSDPTIIDSWFTVLMDKHRVYSWNDEYAPSRGLIGKIEHYRLHSNPVLDKESNDTEPTMHSLLKQSALFRDRIKSFDSLRSDDPLKYNTIHKQVTHLCSASEWLEDHQQEWVHALYRKSTECPELMELIHFILTKMEQIACIDTEFFVGKYHYNHMRRSGGSSRIPDDVAIGQLYNIGIATNNGKPISILIKHPTLSLEDRLNLFSCHRGKEDMMRFLKPVLQHHIDKEGVEDVSVDEMTFYELEKYFNRYAVMPRAAFELLHSVIQQCPYLLYHFSHWDRKLIQLLAEYCDHKEVMMESHDWLNSTKLIHAMLPRKNVISHSLEYLTNRLCSRMSHHFSAHLGESDAMALMEVIKVLRGYMIAAGISVKDKEGKLEMKVNDGDAERLSDIMNQKDLNEDNQDIDSTDCELYRWIYSLGLPQYYEALKNQGFEDDVSLIAELTDDDLISFGITKKAHRIKIAKHAVDLLTATEVSL